MSQTSRSPVEMLQDTPEVVRWFWRKSYPNGRLALCGRHALEWPRALGTLRLQVENSALNARLHSLGVPVRLASDTVPPSCYCCDFAGQYPRLNPYEFLESYGPGLAGHRQDDGQGMLADPAYGQPIVVERIHTLRIIGSFSFARWFNDRIGQEFECAGVASFGTIHETYLVLSEGALLELPHQCALVVR